ncbi:methylmalonyl-CoA mutase family protein [Sporosarcina siberiensis]|uniref:Methylmalonyl-CoA mutase family protein n=1 Tax=Sporosarcina siberiensis TaxID=1365606 RepID=A0ABW4SB69_9BACL
MTIHKMKTITFQDTDYETWKEVALASLKGQPFDQLITKTIEGIDLQPLYTEADLLKQADGVLAQSISAIRNSKIETGWIIAQQQYAEDGKAFLVELKNSIDKGNGAIVYDGSVALNWEQDTLAEIALLLPKYPVFIKNISADDAILEVFNLVPTDLRAAVQGAVSALNWSKPKGYVNVRAVCADSWTVHHKGADAVTELALTLAQAAENASSYKSFDEFAKDFYVRFAIDTNFFLEIAKIRAFRVLWHSFSSAYNVEKQIPVLVHAETSLRSYSKLDSYVNLLRAGNETFSAVLGGADVVTVHPHDVLTGTTTASRRLARNIQIVLKEETHTGKVIDPSAGSYYIETLTAELVEKAWKLFLEIDASGGYLKYVAGPLEKRLEELTVVRQDEVAKGKKSLIGTNVYANLDETLLPDVKDLHIEGRFAEQFEKSRVLFSTSQPKTTLLTFGELKDYKIRADFASGFLATGGIWTIESPAFQNVQDALNWLATEKPDYAIVCASPEFIDEAMDELLLGMPSEIAIDVAGKFDEKRSKDWIEKGLSGFIFSGQNRVEKFLEINEKWKGAEEK